MQRLLIVPDTNAPYHDTRAWSLMLKAAKWFKPNIIVHLGDLPDFYSISSYPKDPSRQLSLAWELESVNACLDDLDSLGAKKKVYVAGNHCFRYDLHIRQTPDVFAVSKTLEEAMRLRERRWEYIPYKEHVKVGKVYYTHDVDSGSRTHKFKALAKYQHSVITAHDHRLIYVVEGNAVGEVRVSAGFGWLGDVSKIDYRNHHLARTEWALGFGIGHMDKDGVTYFTPIPIVDYTCCVNGKVFRA